MDRIYASGAAGSAPSVPASPSSGYPTAGNPGTGTPATKPGPYWYHMIMEELMAIITAGAITPAPGTLNQVKQALDALYAPKGSGGSKIQPIGASVGSNALTLTLNPTSLDFRANSMTSGVVNSRTVGSAISLVVPAGATLGTINGQQARLALLAIDNAGALELAVANLAGGLNLDETTLISTTAISAAANSASTIYSATARSNVPFRVVGYIDITQAAAGTWASAPTVVQGQGGQALAALQSLGFGQTMQNVTGSRAKGATYYNTTGRPIALMIGLYTPSTSVMTVLAVNGVDCQEHGGSGSSIRSSMFAVVPAGGNYSLREGAGSSSTVDYWVELR